MEEEKDGRRQGREEMPQQYVVLSYPATGEYSGSAALTEDQTNSYLKPAVWF